MGRRPVVEQNRDALMEALDDWHANYAGQDFPAWLWFALYDACESDWEAIDLVSEAAEDDRWRPVYLMIKEKIATAPEGQIDVYSRAFEAWE